MQAPTYFEERSNIIAQPVETSTILTYKTIYGQYTMMSANLSNYLPEIDPASHMKLFQQLLIHKQLTRLEQASKEALEELIIENETGYALTSLAHRPSIYCTFHTGSYRIVNLFLMRHNVPFSLVIGSAINKAEGDEYLQQQKLLFPNSDFSIIDAENPSGVVQMMRALKSGRSLLFYLDGNTGTGAGNSQNANCCCIHFLHQQLFARNGVAYLSHVCNVSIIPVINYRPKWEEVRLRLLASVFPEKQTDRNVFSQVCTQDLYNMVAPYIKLYPEQWEGWLYVHKWTNIIHKSTQTELPVKRDKLSLNLHHYGVFSIGDESFLLKKSNYSAYPIEFDLYRLLKNSIHKPIGRDQLDAHTLEELELNGVVH